VLYDVKTYIMIHEKNPRICTSSNQILSKVSLIATGSRSGLRLVKSEQHECQGAKSRMRFCPKKCCFAHQGPKSGDLGPKEISDV